LPSFVVIVTAFSNLTHANFLDEAALARKPVILSMGFGGMKKSATAKKNTGLCQCVFYMLIDVDIRLRACINSYMNSFREDE
jgi:sialic acid synthase SpsE